MVHVHTESCLYALCVCLVLSMCRQSLVCMHFVCVMFSMSHTHNAHEHTNICISWLHSTPQEATWLRVMVCQENRTLLYYDNTPLYCAQSSEMPLVLTNWQADWRCDICVYVCSVFLLKFENHSHKQRQTQTVQTLHLVDDLHVSIHAPICEMLSAYIHMPCHMSVSIWNKFG